MIRLATALWLLSLSAQAQQTPCAAKLDATFVQLNAQDLTKDVAGWRDDLDVLVSLGIQTAVIQYSGAAQGSYDDRSPSKPVRSFIRAAGEKGVRVYVGLHSIPDWYSAPMEAASRLPAPLDTPAGRSYLRSLARLPAFAGWYLPGEIDEWTWNRPDHPAREAMIKSYLERAAKALRGLHVGPTQRDEYLRGEPSIMIAPFWGETQTPDVYAAFLARVLVHRPVTVLAMQDGRGARGTKAADVQALLSNLTNQLAPGGIEVWAVTELFVQVHGEPVDSQPFAAVPVSTPYLRQSLQAERNAGKRIAFTVLDYMDPRSTRFPTSRQLYLDYTEQCAP